MLSNMFPLDMITIREYLALRGRNIWEEWFDTLGAPAAAKVTTAVVRNEQGDFSKTSVSTTASENAGSNSAPPSRIDSVS
jgi:hypothetical protein